MSKALTTLAALGLLASSGSTGYDASRATGDPGSGCS
jgi:hypothetical protein